RHEKHYIRARQQRQRPIGPIGRKIDEHRTELGESRVDDRQQLVAVQKLEWHDFARGRNDMKPALMAGCNRTNEVPVQPLFGLNQVTEGQRWLKAQLQCRVAKLDIEIDEASFAPGGQFASGKAARQLAQQRSCANAALALYDGD